MWLRFRSACGSIFKSRTTFAFNRQPPLGIVPSEDEELVEEASRQPIVSEIAAILRRLWGRLYGSVHEFLLDDCPTHAAAVSYYAASSLFPGLLLILTLMGAFVSDSGVQEQIMGLVNSYLPVPRLQDFVAQNLHATLELRGPMGLFSVVALLWAAKNLAMGLEHGVNATWALPRRRTTWTLWITSVLMTVLLLAALAAQFFATAAANAVLAFEEFTIFGQTYHLWKFAFLSSFIVWIISPLALFGIFSLLYKMLPTITVPYSAVWPGALFATVAWKLVERGFILYTTHVAAASALYGAASMVLALLLWFYLSASIFFLGAEFIFVLLVERDVLDPKRRRLSLLTEQKEV